MDVGPLRTLVFDINRNVHGVDVTVTLPGDDPITTRGIWLATETLEAPGLADLHRRDPIRMMALGTDAVPSIPRGALVVAPGPLGGTPSSWRVDGTERTAADHHRVYLIPDPEQD